MPLEDTGFGVGEAIPVSSTHTPPQLSSCIATQLSLHRETRVQYTSVHHGKWRGNRSQTPPLPRLPSQPHADHKRGRSIVLQSVSWNNARLPTGKQEKQALGCWVKFVQLICTAPQHHLSPIATPPCPRAVCYQFILCECSVSPHHICSVQTMLNGTGSLMGNSFFHLVTKISCLIRANEGWVCHPLLFSGHF